jgi:hypothetical protein
MQQLRNWKVNEKCNFTSGSLFILKSPNVKKRNTSIYIRGVLLCYLTLVCLVRILIHYFLCNVVKTCSVLRIKSCVRMSGHLCNRAIANMQTESYAQYGRRSKGTKKKVKFGFKEP